MAYFMVKPRYKKSNILDDDKIYGITWTDLTSTACTRTDDAVGFSAPDPQMSDGNGGWVGGSSPFDNIMPWAGMLKTEFDNAGTLVAIPKFYFKLEYPDPSLSANARGVKLQISRQEFTGSKVSPAHMDRGDGAGERDVVYVGRYHCNSSNISTSGVDPRTLKERWYFRSSIHVAARPDIWIWDYATLMTIQLLYLVEFADWDAKAKIGMGGGSDGYMKKTGLSDSMPYHTGTIYSARTTYGAGIQYRNIEDLWANVYDWVDGINFNKNNNYLYIQKNPAAYSDGTSGASYYRPSTTGRIKNYQIQSPSNTYFPSYFMFPTTVVSTGKIDYFNYDSTGTVLNVGGCYSNTSGTTHGLFYYGTSNNADTTGRSYGARLMKLP